MKLTTSGTIKVDGHLVRFTDDGQWMVSRNETIIGYVDSLAEVSPLIETHLGNVRAKLADVERRAAERKAEAEMPAEILAATLSESDRESNRASLNRAANRFCD